MAVAAATATATVTATVPAAVPRKHYPRDYLPKGRIKVQLRGDDGKPINPDIPDRRTLLLRLAELVPKHPGRAAHAKAKTAAASKAAEAPSGSGAGGSNSNKPAPSKKGKKGKK
ncbi:Signal recognition particle protein [Tetrabaena socialis]|uniref:Signal recognition particle protein n=1 Tax=Tetrabaena socialis TaxID=47790 RepID=A0A2J8A7H6_9CHLO|nr:Signal recognition particle protein [Tetrabaena socialis]|eukprot:PNH08467.1 Signal recognition particle protein [Tetrabaena socialis]